MSTHYDVLAFGAHPDDLEAVLGGTAAKLVAKGRSVLFVDMCDGEPTRHGEHGQRAAQAARAATILGVDRYTLLLGVRYAEAFKARSPLIVADPEAFGPSRFG